MDSTIGHVKRDPATGDVAIRTFYTPDNEKLAEMLWLRASSTRGVKYLGNAAVAGWDDLFVPEPVEVEEPQA